MTGRYPGFDGLNQAPHWDQVTKDLIEARVRTSPPAVTFFSATERGCAHALLNDLTGQDRDDAPVPVTPMVEARLAAGETDGWRYDDMPEDGQAWRESLRFLDEDSRAACSCELARASVEDQRAVIQSVQDLGVKDWHGLNAAHVWSLWTRYACTAFYAHPSAWNEIGFPGPAYPRGYKNPGTDAREPYEVADTRPSADPLGGKDR